jgi:hypothetical protein
VFRTEGKFPERPGFETLKAYREKRIEQFTSAGILAGNGESWWNVRSKAQQPFLKTKNVNNYIPVLGQIAQEFIDRLILDFITYQFITDIVFIFLMVLFLETKQNSLDPTGK